MRFLAIAGLLAGLGLGAADAATIRFDTSNSGSWSDSIVYDPVDFGLTVTGTTATGGTTKVQTWKGFGLGVKSAEDCDSGRRRNICEGDDHQVDSSGPDDVAVFLFTETVRILSVSFNYVDRGDTFDLYVNGLETVTAQAVSTKVLLNTAFSTLFAVGAGETSEQSCYRYGYGRHSYTSCKTKQITSGFKITAIEFERMPAPPVPLPASALLLVGALGGLGLLRRRSRKSA